MPCSGDSTQTCGGIWANSVYKTGYLGCFTDTPSRDLAGNAQSLSTQTPQQCMTWCGSQGYKYAGVQFGDQCFCGNSFDAYGASTSCNVPCAGNSGQTCGGAWANSVYLTGR